MGDMMNENQTNPTNLLIQSALDILEGRAEESKFQQLLSERITGLQEARSDFLQKAEKMQDHLSQMGPELDNVKTGFDAYEAALTGLAQYLENQDRQIIEQNLPLLQESAFQLFHALNDFDHTFWLKGPSNYPIFNQLLNSIKGARGGYLPPEVVGASLDLLKENFAALKHEFEQLNPQPDSPVAEELPKLEELFSNIDRIAHHLKSYLTTPEVEILNQCESEILEISGTFAEVQEKLLSIFEQAKSQNCIKCNYANPLDAVKCRQCGSLLPGMDMPKGLTTFQVNENLEHEPTVTLAGVVLTENLEKILDSINLVKEGQTTLEEFTAILDWMDELLNLAEKEMPAKPILSDETLPEAEEDRELVLNQQQCLDAIEQFMLSGIEKCRRGIEEMRLYQGEEEQTPLDNGLNLFWQGAGEISLVQQLTSQQPQEDSALPQDAI